MKNFIQGMYQKNFGQTRHESRQLAGAAQLPFIYYRDIVGTGVYRIRNACQYVPRRLFD